MLRVWGRISSINVRKVVWCAQELGLAFERVDAGGKFGVVSTPEYQARNPNALVPLIEEGKGDELFELWESNVIVRYLCARHASGSLYPESLRARFDAERWMDWQQTTLNRVSAGAFVQLIRTAVKDRKPELVAQSVAASEPLFAMLDAHLAGRSFMCGEHFSMADIPLGCEAHRWFGLPASAYARPSWPNLERWFASLRARPAAAGVLDLVLE